MARPTITAERLREVLEYDPETGVFTWRVRASQRTRVGDTAGSLDKGYVLIQIGGRKYRAHRLAWLYVHGEWPPHEIDHKFGVRDDNRLSEIRLATDEQNMQNQRMAHANNKCGLLGVYADRGRWRGQITVDGVQKHLGMFDTPEDAHAAYLEAKAILHKPQTLVVNAGMQLCEA